MKCSELIELGKQCGIKDALRFCPDYDKKTGDCLYHKRELQELNRNTGCLTVFEKKEGSATPTEVRLKVAPTKKKVAKE